MQISVKDSGTPQLLQPGTFTQFEAVIRRGEQDLPAMLAQEGEQHVWVDESWLRRELAHASPVPDWEQKYESMLAYARSKGWVRERPLAIRAHIVWTD